MRAGLENGEMELHYQPLVSLQDGQVVGCEALLRWTRPGHGAVSPAEMIPIAESTGFVITIGRWALRLACAEALTWPAQMCVAVNISSIHFRLPDFFADVEAVLTETGLAPERLEIEITESNLPRQHAARPRQPPRAAGTRRADRPRRFRDGLLVAELPDALSGRQDQDRPGLRPRPEQPS